MEPVSIGLPTTHGTFTCFVWPGEHGRELVALATMKIDASKELTVRIHSECLTGDTFHSLSCDCEEQKDRALQEIQKAGNGVFIYHRQEGRNAGLYNKMRIYALMQHGIDTYDASVSITGHADAREYSDVLVVLRYLGISKGTKIKLLTDNPDKVGFLKKNGYSVAKQPFKSRAGAHNSSYLSAQALRFE